MSRAFSYRLLQRQVCLGSEFRDFDELRGSSSSEAPSHFAGCASHQRGHTGSQQSVASGLLTLFYDSVLAYTTGAASRLVCAVAGDVYIWCIVTAQ